MHIGLFDKVVRFDKNIPTVLGAGYADAYTTLLTTKGYLKKKSGSRFLSAGEILNEESFDLWVRYQTALASNLRSDSKIVIDGETYTPQTWEKIDEKKFYYHFVLNKNKVGYSLNGVPGESILVDLPLELSTTEGALSVQSNLLINVAVYLVAREGMQYKKVLIAPAGRQFRYTANTGTIDFEIGFNAGETIYILYKS